MSTNRRIKKLALDALRDATGQFLEELQDEFANSMDGAFYGKGFKLRVGFDPGFESEVPLGKLVHKLFSSYAKDWSGTNDELNQTLEVAALEFDSYAKLIRSKKRK